jgi:predicted transcriptional regulator
MNKCEKFLEFFDDLIQNSKYPIEMPEDVKEFYDILKSSQEKFTDKPEFTENGLIILEYMIENQNLKSMKARDIAEGINVPSRNVSGAMRKLVADGYVEKFGQNPVIYALSNKGKNFNLKEYKENNEGWL